MKFQGKQILILLLFVLIIPCGNSFAQDKLVITLDKAIEISLKQSPTLRSVLNALRRDGKWVDAARAGLKSNAHCEFYLPNFDESIKEEYDSADQLYHLVKTQNLKYEGKIRINQPLITNGNISLNGSLLGLKQYDQETSYRSNLFVEIRQPIFTSSTIKREIRRAELNFENTELQYIGKWVSHIFQIKTVFYQIFRHSYNYQIDKKETDDVSNSCAQANTRYEKGEIDKLSLNQIRMKLLSSQERLLNAERVLKDNEDWFKQLIGLPLETAIEIQLDLDYKPVNIHVQESVERGIANSTELRTTKINRELNSLLMDEINSNREFKGEFVVTYGLDNAGDRINTVFNDFDKSKSVLLTFSVPLWDWGRNNSQVNMIRTVISKIDNSYENRLQAIKERIINQATVTRQALRRLSILKRSEEIAQRSFELTEDKFNKNLVSSQEMIQAQNRVTSSRRSYLNAFIQYKNALIDLERDTYWDIENQRNLLKETRKFIEEYIQNDYRYMAVK